MNKSNCHFVSDYRNLAVGVKLHTAVCKLVHVTGMEVVSGKGNVWAHFYGYEDDWVQT